MWGSYRTHDPKIKSHALTDWANQAIHYPKDGDFVAIQFLLGKSYVQCGPHETRPWDEESRALWSN